MFSFFWLVLGFSLGWFIRSRAAAISSFFTQLHPRNLWIRIRG